MMFPIETMGIIRFKNLLHFERKIFILFGFCPSELPTSIPWIWSTWSKLRWIYFFNFWNYSLSNLAGEPWSFWSDLMLWIWMVFRLIIWNMIATIFMSVAEPTNPSLFLSPCSNSQINYLNLPCKDLNYLMTLCSPC